MLQTIDLTKQYDDKTAVRRLNLHIKEGEIFCLLGPNGAGKTTTVNLFMGFVRPDNGRALVNSVDVEEKPDETKKYLAYIPENLALYPNLTGLENLTFFAGLSGIEHSQTALCDLLLKVGLQEAAHHKRVSQYSKGMRQKVGIAIALAKQAKALLLDEPTSGLDPQASNEVAALLKELANQGVAILMTTHDLFRAKETGTHVGIMRNGELIQTMTTGELNHADLEQIYLKNMNL